MRREAEIRNHRSTIAVVLNYRTPYETIAAVRSLHTSGSAISTIIVVDNASDDGSAQMLARELPHVRLILADMNAGFSSGCNIGIREALRLGASRVLLLNSDVVAPPDAIGLLERALDRDASLGIVGPVLASQSDPNEIQSLGIKYRAATGRMRHEGYGTRRTKLAPFERHDVDGVSGCAMMIRREVFERMELLAEEYFFGFEDLDFCLRARAAGFATACIGAAVVLHEGSVSIGRVSAQRIYFATRNHLLLAERFRSSPSLLARCLQTTAVLAFNLAHVLVTSEVPRLRGLRGFIRGVRDHFAGRYGSPSGFRLE